MTEDWHDIALDWGIPLDSTAEERFALFARMLEETNREFNLTRIPPESYGTLHFLDSLALLKFQSLSEKTQVIDVGTGAGFPGLPLAIVSPQVRFVMLDTTRKRLAFIDKVIEQLALKNVTTIHARAEDLAKTLQHRNAYDLVLSRAVAPLSRLLGWTAPFAKLHGNIVAYKSRDLDNEIAEAQSEMTRLNISLQRIEEIVLPAEEAVRKLAFFATF